MNRRQFLTASTKGLVAIALGGCASHPPVYKTNVQSDLETNSFSSDDFDTYRSQHGFDHDEYIFGILKKTDHVVIEGKTIAPVDLYNFWAVRESEMAEVTYPDKNISNFESGRSDGKVRVFVSVNNKKIITDQEFKREFAGPGNTKRLKDSDFELKGIDFQLPEYKNVKYSVIQDGTDKALALVKNPVYILNRTSNFVELGGDIYVEKLADVFGPNRRRIHSVIKGKMVDN